MSTAEIRARIRKYLDSGDERLIKMVYAMIKEYVNDETVVYTVDGKPLTKEEYAQSAQEAVQSIKDGNYTTHDDLLKEVKNW